MKRTRILGLLIAIAVLGGLATIGRADTGQTIRIPGHVLPAIARATVVASKPNRGAQPITLTVVLKRDDQAAFERYLKDHYDPHSPNFHHFLTQPQIAGRFGPSRDDYGAVLAYLHGNGLRLVAGSKNRLTLTVRGSRVQAERAFGIQINDYALGKRTFYANDRDPAMPGELAPRVSAVVGLSNLARPQHSTKVIHALFCRAAKLLCRIANPEKEGEPVIKGCYDPDSGGGATNAKTIDCGEIKEFSPPERALSGGEQFATGPRPTNSAVPWSSADGTGQTIGLVEFDTFSQSDVVNFLAYFGHPAGVINQLSQIAVSGGVASPGVDQDEVLIDVDTTLSLAPGASTVVYDAPFSGAGSFQAVFNQMIENKVTIISNSWAYCEDETTLADAQSVDLILQNAAAAGISVFNGTGDSGSTCLDGSTNTIPVPADSPNATAVGGSSENSGPSFTYGPETWWDDSTSIPAAGQGGFGTSRFFALPSYQTGFTGGMRSVPDVVVNADPFQGIEICEASNGGCPNGLQYAGTSFAAPQWASFAALLNQTIGTNQGLLNPLLYPLAAGGGFHQPGALGSDFAHVGLGSPNLNALFLQLTAQSAGAVSASNSAMAISLDTVNGALPPGLADDGTTAGTVTIWLRDANGNSVAGKTVTLSAIAGTSVKISPASAVTTADNGAVNFQITDTAAESPTLTATDTTDGVTLTQQLIGDFAVAPAAAAGLNVFPTTVTGDGVTPTDITVTLNDSLGRPTPGKTVLITQTGGNSVISGPVPAVTNSNGMISFTAVDSNDETVTYSAVDVTDGYVPFPTTGTVTFDNAPEPGCSTTLPMAPDYIATPYAQGFLAQSYSFGNINFNGCGGVYGMAFDSSGNLFAADQVNGNLYKFPPGGGLVGGATLLGTLGPSLQGLAFDKSGNLYGSRDATTGNFFTGAVMQIDPANASIIQTVSGLTCPSALSVDPLSGDLFTDDSCFGSGADNSALWRISGLPTTPVLSVYANLPHTPNANIAFAPSGTMYVWDSGQDAKVTATNGPTPPVVTVLPGLGQANLGLLAFGMQSNGDANYLITNFPPDTSITPNGPPTASIFDLTATPPAVSSTIIGYGSAENLIVGPDGCVYAAQGTGIWRITDSAGLCTYAAPVPAASLVLTPVLLFPSPTQGSPITLTAAFHNTTVTTGTPVVFTVTGANPQSQQVLSTAAGIAAFTYTAAKQGVDTIVARATAGTTPLTSNQSVITWGPGSDVTFLSLNGSPTTAMPNLPTTVVANLTDVSVTPVAPVAGQTVSFLINGAGGCSAVTDASGNATCALTAGGAGIMTLSASFAGVPGLNPSSNSQGLSLIVIPSVTGTLKITPTELDFGKVDIGDTKTKTVTIKNKGKITKKLTASSILIETESTDNAVFTIAMSCTDDSLVPKAKHQKAGKCTVQVTFTPTAAVAYSGNLDISDNLAPGLKNIVPMDGTGKTPKKPE